jgi:hypothetical protein
MKYKQGDVCIVYKDTPTYSDGGVVQVIDRDPNDGSYSVAHLQEVGKCDMDIIRILQHHAKWVKEEDLQLIDFTRPMKVKEKKPWIQNLRLVLSELYVNLRTAINRALKR